MLNECPLDWLLEEENPSVRYFTLVHILEKPKDSPEAIDAKKSIMENGPVPCILEKQNEGGYWGKPEDFYLRSKFKGTVWTLILLAELGADGTDPRIKKACDFILNSSRHSSGGFAFKSAKDGGGNADHIIPCLTGNMTWSLIRLGHLDDPRVQESIDFITRYRRFDDGEGILPRGWPYEDHENCWGRHTCHMGVVKSLKALAAIPDDRRCGAVKETLEEGAEYLFKHHIYKRSHDLSKVSKPKWLEFGIPLMYETNVLEILDILTNLGYHDERMQEAMDLVVSKQDEHGRWMQESARNGRYIIGIERIGKPGKWVTLRALKVLKSYYSCCVE
jgi:hypothetical protein